MTSTTETHPLEELALFAEGRASSQQRHRVVRHLLKGCASCAGRLRGHLVPEADPDALSAAVDRVLERATGLMLQTNRGRARGLDQLEHLDEMSATEQARWIDGLEPAERKMACEALIDRCREFRRRDAAVNLRLAQLAVRAVEEFEEADRFELAAAAWAELGNARRIPGDFSGAEKALTRAEELLEPRGGDSEVEATTHLYRAALAHDRRQYDQAVAHYQQSHAISRELGDELGEIRVLVGLGLVQSHLTDPRDGMAHLRKALKLLERQDAPELLRLALHNMAHLSLDAGDPETALQYVQRARPLFEEGTAPRLDRLRFEWLVGRLARDLGRLEDAAESLEQARRSYLDEDLPYEVALVALDLAVVYVRLSEREKLRRLAGETVGIFRTLGIAQESIMALNLLARAEAAEAYEIVAQLSTVVEQRHPRRGGSITAGG